MSVTVLSMTPRKHHGPDHSREALPSDSNFLTIEQMKHIKLRTILAATASLILLGSCNDYLDILPTNDVVLYNFCK